MAGKVRFFLLLSRFRSVETVVLCNQDLHLECSYAVKRAYIITLFGSNVSTDTLFFIGHWDPLMFSALDI